MGKLKVPLCLNPTIFYLGLLGLATIILKVESVPQEILVYKNENACSEGNGDGYSQRFTETASIPETSWISTDGASLKVVTGIWRILSMDFSEEHGSTSRTTDLVVHPGKSKCLVKSAWWDGSYRNTFTRVGPADTSTSTLYLFTSSSLWGNGLQFTVTGSIPRLDPSSNSVTIESFAHFSNKSWIFYPEPSFQGERECRCPVDKEGKVWEKDEFDAYYGRRQIGSVKEDKDDECKCFSKEGGGDGGDGNGGGGAGSLEYSKVLLTLIIIVILGMYSSQLSK